MQNKHAKRLWLPQCKWYVGWSTNLCYKRMKALTLSPALFQSWPWTLLALSSWNSWTAAKSQYQISELFLDSSAYKRKESGCQKLPISWVALTSCHVLLFHFFCFVIFHLILLLLLDLTLLRVWPGRCSSSPSSWKFLCIISSCRSKDYPSWEGLSRSSYMGGGMASGWIEANDFRHEVYLHNNPTIKLNFVRGSSKAWSTVPKICALLRLPL